MGSFCSNERCRGTIQEAEGQTDGNGRKQQPTAATPGDPAEAPQTDTQGSAPVDAPIVKPSENRDFSGERWVDAIETAYYTIPIDAEFVTNGPPCPIRKVKRHSFTAEEVQRIAEAMLPPVKAVWNSADYSKQEYERAVASLTERGHTDRAKIAYDIMSKGSYPDEAFTETDRIAVSEQNKAQTYLCENGRYAIVSYYDKFMLVNAARHSVPHSESLLSIDGHYGEGPVTVLPTISQEEAEELAYDFLERAGLKGYYICDMSKSSYFDLVAELEYSQGWYFYLVRVNEYVPVEMQRFGAGDGMFRFGDDSKYSAPWFNESMQLYVSEAGVEFFVWTDGTEVVEIVNENVELMSVANIKQRMKNMMRMGLSWMESLPAPFGETKRIGRIILTQTLIPVKNEPQYAYLVPTWACELDSFLVDGTWGDPEYACFNAVDGSPISLAPPY